MDFAQFRLLVIPAAEPESSSIMCPRLPISLRRNAPLRLPLQDDPR